MAQNCARKESCLMNVHQWLESKVPPFKELGGEERREIMEFSLLWPFFEFRLLDTFATAEKIVRLCHRLDGEKKIDSALLVEAIAYWRARYYANGDFTDHFHSLTFRDNDREDAVRVVLEGKENSGCALLLCALLIVWRFRNNLFHGTKWTYALKDQQKNFEHANRVLMAAMDMDGVNLID